MRRSIAKIPYRASTTSSLAAAFSTSSSGGGGRGRGGGGSPFRFTADSPTENAEGAPPPPHGHGRGRGTPIPSSPILPSFSSFVNNDSKLPPSGRGRGFVLPNSTSPPPPPQEESEAEMPFLFGNDKEIQNQNDSAESEASPVKLSDNIMNILSGAGRGKPIESQSEKPTVENRHIRPRQSPVAAADKSYTGDQLSEEEKVKRAREILSRGGETEGGRGSDAVRSDRGRGDDIYMEAEDGLGGESDLDPAAVEELTRILGPETISEIDEMIKKKIREKFRDTDALDENLRIECEPEYLMEVFGTNPDIDEKPPMPIRDALEKMKPYLMAYEGIQTQEEWEKYVEKAMKRVPLLKEIVDHYSGPDRVTAKEQQVELERVAKTLPASAPDSVKSFTDRALLSLQSNPGWRFDQKCKFMDKLVMEVSQHYK